jgi:hypothetical protein
MNLGKTALFRVRISLTSESDQAVS